MALPINKITSLTANNNYFFEIYFNPSEFSEALNALKHVIILSIKKLKFEYGITDLLSAKSKGFYIFTIEDFKFPSIDFRYLLYIGRVVKTNSFKNRFYIYRNSIGDESAIENVMLLTNLWPDNTYVYFFEVKNDKEIEEVEKILVNKLRPYFNEQYFTKKSVHTTSLYKAGNP